jgi:hypothetical protein
MRRSLCLWIPSMCLVMSPAVALAQSTEVTFRVPVNLSQLTTDIKQVRVACRVDSPAIVTRSESGQAINYYFGYGPPVPVADGRVVTTATVVVPIPRLEDPAGKTATYTCFLQGSTSGGAFSQFGGASWPQVALRLSPTPTPITGSFPWVEPPTATAPPNVTTTSPGGNP